MEKRGRTGRGVQGKTREGEGLKGIELHAVVTVAVCRFSAKRRHGSGGKGEHATLNSGPLGLPVWPSVPPAASLSCGVSQVVLAWPLVPKGASRRLFRLKLVWEVAANGRGDFPGLEPPASLLFTPLYCSL
jgi:hypothetical protein